MIAAIQSNRFTQTITSVGQAIYQDLAARIQRWVVQFFSMGFQKMDPVLKSERCKSLIQMYEATPLDVTSPNGPVDALYIPCKYKSKTGNVLVLCLTTHYQKYRSKHFFPYLTNGADIVLWNPVKKVGPEMAQDLLSILQTLRKNNPNQIIAVQGMCASVEPAIHAVSQSNDPDIHLIADRGYGDVYKLARSLTIFAALPIARQALKAVDCEGNRHIQKVKGHCLFMIPKKDQLLDIGGTNLTRELAQSAASAPTGPTVHTAVLDTHNHWAHWNYQNYDAAFKFLAERKIIWQKIIPANSETFPVEKDPWFATAVLPWFLKSYL